MIFSDATKGIPVDSSSETEFSIPTSEEIDEYARMCVDHGADALVILNKDARLIWQNRAFERITGFSLRDFLGRTPRDLLVCDKTDKAELERFAQLYEAQIPSSIELQFRRKNKEYFWLEVNVTPIFNDLGKLKYYITSSRETTARRQLRKSHEHSILTERSAKKNAD